MAEKFYTAEDIANKFSNLSSRKKNDVLYAALDYMQQYNGRSKILCIAMICVYKSAM